MKSLWGLYLLGLVISWSVSAVEPVCLGKFGDLRLNGARSFYWFHAGPKWSSNKRMNQTTFVPEKIQSETGKQIVAGKYMVSPEDHFRFRSVLTKTGKEEYLYEATFLSEKPVPSTALFWVMEVPLSGGLFRAEVDGKTCVAPDSFEKLAIVESTKAHPAKKVAFQAGNRKVTLESSFVVRIQDDRRFKLNRISLRIFPLDSSSLISNCSLRVKIRLEALKSVPLDLSGGANMGFADRIADDGKGGWTDQGPENDLSCMIPGELDLGGIRFRILDPAKNGGRSCLVLSESRRYPKAGSIAGDGKAHEYLYLLHACAWSPGFRDPIGWIRVIYADGEEEKIPVRTGIDIGNWWRPTMSYPNGFLLLKGTNFGGSVGLFVSAFKLKNSIVREMEFIPGPSGVWMIAGASFSNLHLERPVEKPYIVVPGKEWTQLRPAMSVRKGSPLDFSRFLHKPAGKYGFVSIGAGGNFVLAGKNGERIRFLGTNLCQSALFPTHEEADSLVEKLAANGYNSVRIHQFERGLMDRKADNTLAFDPVQLDRLQYLIARLKQQGLYICTDICATRPIRPGDGIAECSSANGLERKVLNYISPTAMANWKEYARRFLMLRNPYTGMSLLEDPALYAVNLDNEAPFPDIWAQYPKVIAVVERAYDHWLEEKNIRKDSAGYDNRKMFRDYLMERQEQTQKEQIDFLRSLGARFLITNLNNLSEKPLYQKFRAGLDFIDSHIYHDHPSYPQGLWTTPTAYHQRSAVSDLGRAFYNQMSIRIPGRPFTVTELQFCNPNRHRAESGLLSGAIASLQDWDGIYRFCYTHDFRALKRSVAMHGFDTVSDPILSLAERVTWFLFIRGDAASSGELIEYGIPVRNPPVRFPVEFQRLGLFSRIGSQLTAGEQGGTTLSSAAKNALDRFAASGKMRSSTGELELDVRNAVLRFQSPKSEGVILNRGNHDGTFLSVRRADGFASISIHSLDDKPLSESDSILLFHLTNAANTGMRFRSAGWNLLDDWGKLPLLARRGRAEIELALPDITVNALSLDGEIVGEIPVRRRQGKVIFTVKTDRDPENAVFCYLLTRRPTKN